MAEQPALLGQPDLGAVGELARLAEVVHERRADQQVRSSAAGAAGTPPARACRPRPCARAARRGRRGGRRGCTARAASPRAAPRRPAAAPAARGTPGRGPRRPGARGSRRAPRRRGRRPAGTRPGRPPRARSIAFTSTCSSSRKRSTRPRTRTSSPRSKRPASRSASRNARPWIAPVRSRSSSARYGRPGAGRQAVLARAGEDGVDVVAGAQGRDAWPRRRRTSPPIMAGRPDGTPLPWIGCSRSAGNAVLTASGHPRSCAPSRAGTTRARRPPRRSRSWAPASARRASR